MGEAIRIRPNAGIQEGTAVILRDERVAWAGALQQALDSYQEGDILCVSGGAFEAVRLVLSALKPSPASSDRGVR